jgi:hypothetical protein
VTQGSGRNDLPAQIEALGVELETSTAELYRHLALYLQVLRQVLPHRVEQACFQIATQIHPRRYAELPQAARLALHEHLRKLTERCCSLLTVEQLAGLAHQIDAEQQQSLRQDRRRLLEQLSRGELPEDAEEGEEADGEESTPPGSVRLGLAVPLSAPFRDLIRPTAAFFNEPPAPADPGFGEESFGEESFAEESFADDSLEEESGSERSSGTQEQEDQDEEETAAAMLLLQSLGEALSAGFQGQQSQQDESATESSPWQGGQLPRDPLRLLRWLAGMEQALSRRLRNLSHALNGELLKLGINNNLLPIHLLDAVLAGRIETHGAAANLLRFPMPFASVSGQGSQDQVVAILLRVVDLEHEEPRLRTCRRRLQQHRQQVRRMAAHYRRLQRRLQAYEAEQLWLQDIRTARPTEP